MEKTLSSATHARAPAAHLRASNLNRGLRRMGRSSIRSASASVRAGGAALLERNDAGRAALPLFVLDDARRVPVQDGRAGAAPLLGALCAERQNGGGARRRSGKAARRWRGMQARGAARTSPRSTPITSVVKYDVGSARASARPPRRGSGHRAAWSPAASHRSRRDGPGSPRTRRVGRPRRPG